MFDAHMMLVYTLHVGWAISYDVHRRDRLAGQAVQDSEMWRQELLQLLRKSSTEDDCIMQVCGTNGESTTDDDDDDAIISDDDDDEEEEDEDGVSSY